MGIILIYSGLDDIVNSKKVVESRLKRGFERNSWRSSFFPRSFLKWHSSEWTHYDVLIGGVIYLIIGIILIVFSILHFIMV